MSDETERKRPQFIVRGQKVQPVKKQIARGLRHRMTAAEEVLWERLRGRTICGVRFRRQQVIDGFIVDFYCHAAALIIEVDGPIHGEQVEYDAARDKVLYERRLHILRLTNDEVMTNLSETLNRIETLCRERMNTRPSS